MKSEHVNEAPRIDDMIPMCVVLSSSKRCDTCSICTFGFLDHINSVK